MRHLLFLLLAMPVLACAQAYPNRAVRVVVTFPPGGTPDIYGRVMAAELQKVWGQPVVVENRTGAGGTIGTDTVAKAAPDGYTLLFAADASVTLAPAVIAKLPYDPVRDLTPIVNVTAGPFVLLANPAFPANTMAAISRRPSPSRSAPTCATETIAETVKPGSVARYDLPVPCRAAI